MIRTTLLWTALLLSLACSSGPSRVFVPGDSFEESLQITTERGERATLRVGQGLVLHAERRSGPWVEVERASLPLDSCWIVGPPPEVEDEVAANLRWYVEPAGTARFNVDFRSDHTRTVHFVEPGVYRLTAESASWCREPFGGNTLTVEVVRP